MAVSFSVLLTYPLQLFPAIELLGPAFQRNRYLSRFFHQYNNPTNDNDDDDDDKDLSGFEPLPPIEEHQVVTHEELDDMSDHALLQIDDLVNKNA